MREDLFGNRTKKKKIQINQLIVFFQQQMNI